MSSRYDSEHMRDAIALITAYANDDTTTAVRLAAEMSAPDRAESTVAVLGFLAMRFAFDVARTGAQVDDADVLTRDDLRPGVDDYLKFWGHAIAEQLEDDA